MLKTLRCECMIDFQLQPLGPILIKKDIPKKDEEWEKLNEKDREWLLQVFRASDKDALPNMFFVRTKRNGRYEPYIPGSSLKGVMRSYAERIARTLRWDDNNEAIRGCCDPFCERPPNDAPPTNPNTSCSDKLVFRRDALRVPELNPPTGHVVYRAVCPICKLFGCQFLQSRLLVSDGYADYSGRQTYDASLGNVWLPRRDGIGIDRFTGGVSSGANFSYEVEEESVFQFTLVLCNFELWQLGLLAFLFQDFQDGLIPVGFGKSRGLGRVRGTINTVEITYFGPQNLPAQGRVRGIGELHHEANSNEGYGFIRPDEVDVQPCPELVADQFGLRHTYTFTTPNVQPLLAAVAPRWTSFIDGINGYEVPQNMRVSYFQQAVQQETEQGGEENG